MKSNALCIRTLAFLSSLTLATSFCSVDVATASLSPFTPVAVFDAYGNNYESFKIDTDVTVFDDSGAALCQRPSPEMIDSQYNASKLKGVHPRILASAEDFEYIKAQIHINDTLNKFYTAVIMNADKLLREDCLIYELRDGVRLWYVSLDFIDRMTTLSMAYRLTGNSLYAQRGWLEMNAVALFDTWHPEHHIDVGGLAVGYAIGYDWLYDYFSDEQRQSLERAANRLCFGEYADGLQNRNQDMKSGILAPNNHNSVMNSGGIMMAAAFYDTNPAICSYIISSLIRATEYTVVNLIPDGSWYEGISYAAMMIEYYSLELATLDKLFGTVYGLDNVEGTAAAVEFVMNLQCNTSSFSYGDGNQGKFYNAGMLYMLDYFGYDSKNFETSLYADTTDMSKCALSLLWYKGEFTQKTARSTEALYESNSVAVARNSWDLLNPTFVGMKGGSPLDTHAHMDIGTFCFFSDGVQWTYDVGAENYNVPGYWNYTDKESGRWQYYRTRAEAHNCIVINPSTDGGYQPDSTSEFTRFEKNDSSVIAVLDMQTSHGSKAASALRGYYFCDTRQSLVVRDEITPVSDGSVYWFMSTIQTPVISDNNVYLYDKSGKSLKLDFVSDCDYEIFITPAEPMEGLSPSNDGNSANGGVSRIVVRLSATAGAPLAFTAKLTPGSAINPKPVSEFDVPIDSWILENSAPVIRLWTYADVDILPAGTSFDMEIAAFGARPTDELRLYEVASDGSTKQLEIGRYNKYRAVTSNDEKYIVAVLCDQSGEEITRSSLFPLTSSVPAYKDSVWNVDFEKMTTKYSSNGCAVTFCDDTGTPLTNDYGNTLKANRSAGDVSSESSVVELSACPIGNNGQSIHLVSRKSSAKDDQAQLNQFGITLTEGVILIEMDYLFKDFNTSKIVAGLNCKADDGTAFWAGTLLLDTNGRFTFGQGKKVCETNRWYNVKLVYDIKAKSVICIIDNEYLGSVIHEDTAVSTNRFSFQLTCTADTEAYADNFKVTNLRY